jgi:hypothetical protein
MKRFMLLTSAAILFLASGASAGETLLVRPVGGQPACPVQVVTLLPTRGLSEVIELVPRVVEVRAFQLDLDLASDVVEASVSVETSRGPSTSVVVTVVRALGKALLKGLATLIHNAV